jgi:hypothetical protein
VTSAVTIDQRYLLEPIAIIALVVTLGGASGLPAAQFPMAHHGAMTAIIAELAALALMAEWAAFLSAR